MFVYRTIEKTVFWEFDSIIMQNMSHNLLLFCTQTWPSPRVIETPKGTPGRTRKIINKIVNRKRFTRAKMNNFMAGSLKITSASPSNKHSMIKV